MKSYFDIIEENPEVDLSGEEYKLICKGVELGFEDKRALMIELERSISTINSNLAKLAKKKYLRKRKVRTTNNRPKFEYSLADKAIEVLGIEL